MSDIKRRMASGALWMVLFRLTDRGIGFLSTLLLARLLVPADFGLVAMGTSMLAALELLSAFNFDLALIQNSRAERRHYDSAWTMAILFGAFNAAAMVALSWPAASFFGEPRVQTLMCVLAVGCLIQGFENIGIVAFQKELELHREFRFGLTKKLVGFVVTLTVAFWLRNYWALLCGMLALRVTGVALSYRLQPYRPRLSLAAARELIGFSKWLLLNNVLIFLNNRGTDFVIGRFSGASSLGLYSLAYELANLPTTELVFPISRAVFPGYARLAGNLAEMRTTFIQVLSLVALLTVPAGVLIGLVAEPLVMVLLGRRWLDAVPLIQVLACFGIARSLHGPNGSVYLALGKPRVIAALQCVQLVIAFGLMLVLVPMLGPIGAAWSILIGAVVAMSSNFVMVLRELGMSARPLATALWRPATGALLTCLAVQLVGAAMGPLSADASFWVAASRLVGLSVAGLATYVATVFLCWRGAGHPAGAEQMVVNTIRSRLSPPRGVQAGEN